MVLISDRLWRERFASDQRAVGRSVDLDGKSFTVIGVLPPDFHFLADADVITPLRPNLPLILTDRSVEALAVLARLKSGVTKDQAEAEIDTIQQELDRQYPDANRSIGVTASSLMQEVLGDVRGTIGLLFGAVGLVLLIACANLASLLLARSTARTREFGVRAALGASRGRMVRQLLTECIVLSLAGGALGVVLAALGLRVLLVALPHSLPRAGNIGLHLPVLLFTAGASIAVGILFGLAPALRCASHRCTGCSAKLFAGNDNRPSSPARPPGRGAVRTDSRPDDGSRVAPAQRSQSLACKSRLQYAARDFVPRWSVPFVDGYSRPNPNSLSTIACAH